MHNKKFENKILLVDDDVKNLQVAMSILKQYNVIYAQSGEKALELLGDNSFDLILLDVVMPNLNGYEVCKIIKDNDKFKNIPIIFLTVKDDERDIVKGFNEGAVDYITKPFYSEVLLKRVELHLSLSHALSDLKHMNTNLNSIVNKQVEEIRQKDQILFQQSKISAMGDMIDIISREWNQPLNIIKLYIQSLSLQLLSETMDKNELSETINKTIIEVSKLDETMNNFQKFFKNDMIKQSVNIKVMIDNVIFLLKEKLNKKNIKIAINGCNLINFDIIHDELKHILLMLISYSIDHFTNVDSEDNIIKFSVTDDDKFIYICYSDNSNIINNGNINKLFDSDYVVKKENFDLGLYLMTVFIEKNGGLLDINQNNDELSLTIRFDK